MVDEGIKQSDEIISKLMKRLESTYNIAYQTAVKNNAKAIEKFDSLTDDALKDLTPIQRKLKRKAFEQEIRRTKALSQNIAAEIAKAGTITASMIKNEMANIYGLNYDYAAFDMQIQSGITLNFAQYDKEQISVLLQETQSPFTKIAYKELGKNKVITTRLQNQFIIGTMNGESQQKLIQRIKAVTGQSTRQAKRVAQTERNRVQSQGRSQAMHEAVEMGLGVQKQWIARMRNTRDEHKMAHLEIVDESKAFSNGLMFPGDPSGQAWNVINCFCILKPMVQSVSPALKKHRDKFAKQSFEIYQRQEKINKQDSLFAKERTYKFRESKSISEANEYATTTLGIPFANYRGIDVSYANEWNKALTESFNRFPELKNNIKFTGATQERNKLEREHIIQQYFKKLKVANPYHSDAALMEHANKEVAIPRISKDVLAVSQTGGKYSGVTINRANGKYEKVLESIEQSIQINYLPQGTAKVRSVLDHEIGHQIDTMLGISKTKQMQELFNSFSFDDITSKLSRYAWNNSNPEPIREFVAEAWSEYVNSETPRTIAKQVGQIIEREYEKWKK